MKRLLAVVVALGVVLLLASPSYAETFLDKLGRGLANGATGWMEYPKQIVETSKEHNLGMGLGYGQIRGVSKGLERTGAGVYDIVTFYLPPYDLVLVDPEFILEF